MSHDTGAASAGRLLRAAREKQGLHIAALAASIKVAPRKLDALENDRWDELSGTTFTRALAQSVCRALRIDAAPVLALLPQVRATELEHVTGKLNAPFREHAVRDEGALAALAQRGLMWAGAALLLAAIVTFWLPPGWLQFERAPAAEVPQVAAAPKPAATPAPAPPAPAASRAASAAAPAVDITHGAPLAATPAPDAASAPLAAGLQLSASDVSWVEVRDGGGRVLLSRIVQRGETIGIDGAAPLRLTVGNAGVTTVVYRGKPVDLSPGLRGNVAHIELN
jgi:cytoskeleton protein RodZ